MTQEQYSQLKSYVAAVNEKLPFYIAILETMVEDQDEKTINVKLSGKEDSLDDLSKTNKRLGQIFTLYNVDGQFEFKGFDKGSEW